MMDMEGIGIAQALEVRHMEEKKRKKRWWIWAAAAVLIIVCVLIYEAEGGGTHIIDIPGGFSLTISLVEGPDRIIQYSVTDEAEIKAVQKYIRDQNAERYPNRNSILPNYPFLSLSSGEGKTARCAVYTADAWADTAGRIYQVTLDPAEILALIPGAEAREIPLEELPGRYLAASINGGWDPRLLLPADPPATTEDLEVSAKENDEKRLAVTVYNPNGVDVRYRPSPHLDVRLGGDWYAVPPISPDKVDTEEHVLAPNGSELFTMTSKDMENRYGALPVGYYRIVVLTYVSEFDLD